MKALLPFTFLSLWIVYYDCDCKLLGFLYSKIKFMKISYLQS